MNPLSGKPVGPFDAFLNMVLADVVDGPASGGVPHDHREVVPGCFRCDLTADELDIGPDCESCNGSGEVCEGYRDEYGSVVEQATLMCPDCDGTGDARVP